MSLNASDITILGRTRFLEALGRETFSTLIALAKPVSLPTGATLFRQGDAADAIYVVLDGWVALLRDDEHGNRSVIDLVAKGESFAEALVAPSATYPVSAHAASDVRLACFETQAVRELFAANPQLPLSIIASLLGHLHRLVARVERDSTWSTHRRVAGFLASLCKNEDGPCQFDLPVEQQLIAARLSMTPTTFSRALTDLSRLGVAARRGRITIEDTGRLQRFARGEMSVLPAR